MHVCAPLSCRFPPEEEQLQLWISSMRTAAGWRPSESARLCSDHFTSDCFQTSGHLYSFAVPSVFQSTVGLHCLHYFTFKMMKHFGGRDPFTFSRIPSAGRFIFMNIILYSFYRGEETSVTRPETSEHKLCDGCEKQLHLIEKSYKLKLLSAQLKLKKYEKQLSEHSHKMTKLERRVVVLQTAVKVMKMRKLMSTPKRSESSSNTTGL
ncbi:uncharacterized protein si:dkey-228b2.6 [Ictalurus furcatus]|uniref:uncharacterized protein si:dkey-228b2.6 n=1 Tax=Ictalurus furcatus TaxID=66913 RepID=UPI002350284C|nr:uncharacterized protein si:dkey-228b2.6 [Ictalurus furcatus]